VRVEKAISMDQVAPNPLRRYWPDWLMIVIVFLVIFNGLPFLAPVFMKLGWEPVGRAIYFVYSTMCHQMAQRSFFLFSPEGIQMYNIAELPVKANGPDAQMVLRRFLGSETLGWKVAWSDRMVSMFLSPLLAAIVYAIARRFGPVKPLSLWAFGLFLLPMALDGGTHMISDISQGIGHGFRDNNAWLAAITANAFSPSFYAGDTLGSFNSLMRLLSGLSFGIGVGWLLYPYIDMGFAQEASLPAANPSVNKENDINTLPTDASTNMSSASGD
jgi:uncharacterized membrane protein